MLRRSVRSVRTRQCGITENKCVFVRVREMMVFWCSLFPVFFFLLSSFFVLNLSCFSYFICRFFWLVFVFVLYWRWWCPVRYFLVFLFCGFVFSCFVFGLFFALLCSFAACYVRLSCFAFSVLFWRWLSWYSSSLSSFLSCLIFLSCFGLFLHCFVLYLSLCSVHIMTLASRGFLVREEGNAGMLLMFLVLGWNRQVKGTRKITGLLIKFLHCRVVGIEWKGTEGNITILCCSSLPFIPSTDKVLSMVCEIILDLECAGV